MEPGGRYNPRRQPDLSLTLIITLRVRTRYAQSICLQAAAGSRGRNPAGCP
jgi:hypothetical protein